MAVQLAGTQTDGRPLERALPVSEPGLSASASENRIIKVASRMILAVAVLLIAAAAALFVFRETYDDKVYPGVFVAGVDIGGMTRPEARTALEAKAAEIENSRAYFDALDRHWAPTLGELGAGVDINSSMDQAFAVGREHEGKARVGSVLETLREETWLPLNVTLSYSELETWAVNVGEELGIRPHNAELIIENGEVSIIPEANGTVVDLPELQELLLTSVAALQAPTSALPLVDELPTTYASDFEPARNEIETALAEPVTVDYGATEWEITPAEFGTFVGVVVDPAMSGPESVSVDVNKREFAKWLSEKLGPSVNKDPKNAKVAWSGKKLVATVEGVDGTRMLPSSLAESTTASFFGDHARVEFPIQVLEPEVNGGNLDQLGITTKLAAGSSNYDGSDDARATNIQVGAKILNGTLVPPHGEFSFNRSVLITAEAGFVEAQVIDGERIGLDIGGGICQLSTTAFRAALYAGLPISEWHPHRYRLGFYELDGWKPGIDASILQPEGDPFGGGDLKFINPTSSWLLVESYTEWPRAFVVIYGPDLGYTVELSEPVYGSEYQPTADLEMVDSKLAPGSVVQTEWAMAGMEVTYYRTVYGASGESVLNDSFYTYFAPRGNLYKVSPDMQGFSPA